MLLNAATPETRTRVSGGPEGEETGGRAGATQKADLSNRSCRHRLRHRFSYSSQEMGTWTEVTEGGRNNFQRDPVYRNLASQRLGDLLASFLSFLFLLLRLCFFLSFPHCPFSLFSTSKNPAAVETNFQAVKQRISMIDMGTNGPDRTRQDQAGQRD